MNIDFSDHDKRVLSIVGQGPYGKELVKILERVSDQVCSLGGIDRGKDYGAQVEGRILFKDFADALVSRLTFEKQAKKQNDPDEFE